MQQPVAFNWQLPLKRQQIAAHNRQTASDAHNHEETPLFAKSIENKALHGTYGLPF